VTISPRRGPGCAVTGRKQGYPRVANKVAIKFNATLGKGLLSGTPRSFLEIPTPDTRFIRLRPRYPGFFVVFRSSLLVACHRGDRGRFLMDSIRVGQLPRSKQSVTSRTYQARPAIPFSAPAYYGRAEEAVAAQERFNAALQTKISVMQSELFNPKTPAAASWKPGSKDSEHPVP